MKQRDDKIRKQRGERKPSQNKADRNINSKQINNKRKRLVKKRRMVTILSQRRAPMSTRKGNTKTIMPIQLKRPIPRTADNSNFSIKSSIFNKQLDNIPDSITRKRIIAQIIKNNKKNGLRLYGSKKNIIHPRQKK